MLTSGVAWSGYRNPFEDKAMTDLAPTTFRLDPHLPYLADGPVSAIMGLVLIFAAEPLTALVGWSLPPAFLVTVGAILLPWALYLGGRLGLPDDAATRWLMAGGMLLASLPVVVLPVGSGLTAAIASRTLVSAWMFGGLLMLAALVRGALYAEQPSSAAKRQAAAP